MANFALNIDRDGQAVRIAMVGDFDFGCVAQVEESLARIEQEGPRTVVIDLHDLTFIDSAGMRAILDADVRARSDGRRLVIVRGPTDVHRVFHISGLDERLKFTDDVFPAPELTG